MADIDEEAVSRRLSELLSQPALATMKLYADTLLASIEEDLPPGAGIDRRILYRKFVTTIMLAEKEGMRKQQELTQAKSDHIASLQSLIDVQQQTIDARGELADQLSKLIEDQKDVIAQQAQLVNILDEGAEFRALRLPH